MDLSQKNELELLQLYSNILKTLRSRGVVRTNNAPVADYAEWLVQEKMNMQLQNNSQSGYDSIDTNGIRYQIKCRRNTEENDSKQLGVIRNYDSQEFDYLIGIIFNEDFSIEYAYKIPHGTIRDYSRYSKHQNGHILLLKGGILQDSRSENITSKLK